MRNHYVYPNDIPIMFITGTNDKHIAISSLIKWKNILIISLE